VVAVAPVTDLTAFKEDHRTGLTSSCITHSSATGPRCTRLSIEHADKIKVPVLLFHGGHDANVNIEQSKSMAARLKAVGAKCELVTWDDLDHQLEDSSAREQMLRKSDQFLRQALGM